MTKPKFVHLGVHSEFSLYDSLVRVKELVSKTKEYGMSALTISDDSNLFATIRMYQGAMAKGIKPIVSSEVHVSFKGTVGNLTLICMNDAGYKNLIKLISVSYENGRTSNDDMPVVDYALVQQYKEGLIVLSGGSEGIIGKHILNKKRDETREFAQLLKSDFGDRFYIELNRVGRSTDNEYNSIAVSLATLGSIPVVATNKVRFISPDSFPAHEIRAADAKSLTLVAYKSMYPDAYTPHQYLKTPAEMAELFKDIPSAIENTVQISNRCSVDIELYVNALPKFETEGGVSETDFLISESIKGLKERLLRDHPDKCNDAEFISPYYDRLEFELKVINDMGFPGYFLIVADFIQWSKDNDIPVGPGRGSGAGSLVAYSLKITDLDPMAYSLLFERFLNPERVSMPDFDIDFCMDKRDLVIQYVADKYGHKAVSQIITFGTLAAKAAIKTSARVQGFPYAVGNRISQAIPNEPGIKIAHVLETQTDFQMIYNSDLDARKIIDRALEIEGITRQTGKHAGGVLISPTTLTDFTPTISEHDGSSFVSQFDKNDVETSGLVKFDFLGLKTLTIIDNTIKAVNRDRAKEGLPPIDISQIPLDDALVYQMYSKGETTAVFQVESRGMKDLLKRLKPDSLEDLIALVALYRPGPIQSGMVDNFVDRKHGREKVSYPDATWQHESLKEILEPTYGIILYQEQVMQIAQVLSGYTLGGADMLRRAMGKKKIEEMDKQRASFKSGAIKNGVDGDLSMKIFDLVEKFAGYGFNKSHSAAYALVSYQTGWLKVHYPAPFMAAVMSADINNTDKIITFAQEAKRMGLNVYPPHINKSKIGFTSESNHSIYFGLKAIANFGENNILPIIEERDRGGEFKDMFDFASRAKMSKRAIKNCIYAGAFDNLGANRATMMNSVGLITNLGKQAKSEAESMQSSLFGSVLDDENIAKYNHLDEWTLKEKLINEIDAIGVSVSGHLLDDHLDEVKSLSDGKFSDYMDISMEDGNPDNNEHSVWTDKIIKTVCVISNTKISTGDKTKQQRATMLIDDGTRMIDCVAFNNVCYQSQQFIFENNIVYMKGKLTLDKKSETHKFVAYEIESLDSIRQKNIDSLNLKIDSSKTNKDEMLLKINKLKERLSSQDKGNCPIVIEYIKSSSEKSFISVGQYEYTIDDHLMDFVKKTFGSENVKVIFKSEGGVSKSRKKAEATEKQITEGNKSRTSRHSKIENALERARFAMSM